MSPFARDRGVAAASGLIAGVVLCFFVLELGRLHKEQTDHAELRNVSLAISRDLRLLDAIRRGDTNFSSLLLEMDLDSSLVALYTARERTGQLDERSSNALSAGLNYRKTHDFVRAINGVDRGDLVEETIKRILNNEPVVGR